jgi:cellulase (glycosyl hydrolase family 5)
MRTTMAVPTRRVLAALSALLVLTALVAGCNSASGGRTNDTPTPWVSPTGPLAPTSNGMAQVRGAEVVDGSGHDLLLRGAMIPTSFAYISRWQKGQDPTQFLNAATFAAMASWHMNVVRINISYWIYLLDPGLYMSRLDQAVAAAHAAHLYVILDYHDDKQSGNPNADGLMHAETMTFWKIIASHYKTDTMMLFDPINEPKYADWQAWLDGNGSDVVGYQQVIAAIRSTNAQQIIVLEPGHGCNCGNSGWAGVENHLPSDRNILFSQHDYAGVVSGNPQSWDAEWGPVLGRYPIYYGEWAVLPHADHPVFCKGLTSANADAITNAFLNYLQARHANWTAWAFNPSNIIQSFNSYAPTTFQSGAPWACEDTSAAQAGMGVDIKQFLSAHP